MAECSGSIVSNNVNIQKQSSVVESKDNVDEDNKTDKVMEPILLDDSEPRKVPKSVLNLLQHFKNSNLPYDRNNVLAGLVYILMLETDFVPSQYASSETYSFNYRRILDFSQKLPNNWKKDNVYTVSFVLNPFADFECNIVCIAMETDLLVNCVVKGVEDGHFSIILDSLMYFIDSTMHLDDENLHNLKLLSQVVKDKLCHPAKQAILRHNNTVADCFEALPVEIILLIMKYLPIRDMLHLGATNSYFNEVSKSKKLWIDRLRLDLNLQRSMEYTYESLKQLYKEFYSLKHWDPNHHNPYNQYHHRLPRRNSLYPWLHLLWTDH